MKIHILVVSLTCLSFLGVAQSVGIGTETPNNNAILELVAPDGDQGLLVPRLSTTNRTATTFTSNLSENDNGLMVYDLDLNKFFFWIQNQWVELAVGNLNGLPEQSSQTGKFLSTDGSVALWSDLDFNSMVNVPPDLADGDDVEDSDADATNEIQDISLTGSDLSLTSGSTIDLSVLQDGIGTDNQSAAEVAVTTDADLLSTDVQSALEELQSEVIAATIIPDDAISTSKIEDGAITDAKIAGMDYTKLTNIPADLADGDDDTQLSDADVEGFGYIKNVPDDAVTTAKVADGAVTDAKITGLDYSKLSNVPADLADGDNDTQLSDSDIEAFGYLKAEADGSATNEIQDLAFDGSNLSITSGSSFDLTSLQDGTGTDDQAANEVPVAPSGDLTATDVQAALEELQSEIVDAASAAIPDNAVTTIKINNGAVTDSKVSDVAFSKLTSVPAGLADGDDDTQLDETAVDTFVANNGYLSSESDPTVPASIKDGIDWTELSNIPADIANGDADTQLDETAVDAFVANNGYLTTVTTTDIADGAVTNVKINSLAFSKLTALPAGLADGDDNTQLDEAAVDAFVADNGYLTGESDPTVPANIKDGIDWTELSSIPADISDGDDDTQLDETAVDAFVADNGYLTTVNTADIADGAITNVKINSLAFSKLTAVPADLADGDDNTQLDETAVDAFVADNGYLTSVSSANITNGTIVNSDVSNSAAIAGTKLASNSVTATQIATSGVGTSEILNLTILNADISASAAINGSKLASNTVTATQIATGGVGTSEILNGTITNTDISSSAAISGAKISPDFGSQAVTADSYTYNSAESRTYSVSPMEFVAITGISEPHRVSYGLSGAEAYSISGNSSSVQALGAPLRIPDGATITRVRLYGRNASATAAVNVNLIQNSMSTATTPTLLFTIPTSTGGVTLFDSGTISYPIGQGSFSYQLLMQADAVSASNFSVTGAILTYIVSSPD